MLSFLLYCIYLKPKDETWDWSMMWCDIERNKQTTEMWAWNEKRYCLCCITLIRIDTILLKNIYNSFQNLLFKKLLASWATKQTYFENFTCPQTHFAHPKWLSYLNLIRSMSVFLFLLTNWLVVMSHCIGLKWLCWITQMSLLSHLS